MIAIFAGYSKRVAMLVLAFLAAVPTLGVAWGQATSGSISVRIMDPSGSAVAGALVSIQSIETGHHHHQDNRQFRRNHRRRSASEHLQERPSRKQASRRRPLPGSLSTSTKGRASPSI